MPLKIVRNDITKMHVDVIHKVSPCYVDENFEEEKKLRDCYKKSLEQAYENKCRSIAFSLIPAENRDYSKEEGIRIAVDEINAFLLAHEMLVYLVVYDDESSKLGRNLYSRLESYIDRHYIEEKPVKEYSERKRFQSSLKSISGKASKIQAPAFFQKKNDAECECMDDGAAYEDFFYQNESALNERMKHLSDTFAQYLFYLIEQKGLNNADVYKRALITKQLFSKIKLNPDYHPDKSTAMRLCVGAMLNLDETKDLLGRAGYALSPCDKRDIIFSFFIENGVYDMIEIDIALEEHDLPCFI